MGRWAGHRPVGTEGQAAGVVNDEVEAGSGGDCCCASGCWPAVTALTRSAERPTAFSRVRPGIRESPKMTPSEIEGAPTANAATSGSPLSRQYFDAERVPAEGKIVELVRDSAPGFPFPGRVRESPGRAPRGTARALCWGGVLAARPRWWTGGGAPAAGPQPRCPHVQATRQRGGESRTRLLPVEHGLLPVFVDEASGPAGRRHWPDGLRWPPPSYPAHSPGTAQDGLRACCRMPRLPALEFFCQVVVPFPAVVARPGRDLVVGGWRDWAGRSHCSPSSGPPCPAAGHLQAPGGGSL